MWYHATGLEFNFHKLTKWLNFSPVQKTRFLILMQTLTGREKVGCDVSLTITFPSPLFLSEHLETGVNRVHTEHQMSMFLVYLFLVYLS